MTKDYSTAKTLVLGCGNMLMKDEGFGCAFVKDFKAHYPDINDTYAIDVGTSGAYFINMLNSCHKKPGNIVVVDAGDFGGEIGEIRVFKASDLKKEYSSSPSIHNWSLPNELVDYGGEVWLVLCQIGPLSKEDLGIDLNPSIKKGLAKARKNVIKILGVCK
ncbi:MAG: hydrogenase maturation protease [Candidatus Methanofastidiosia archaeon]